jgi:hypothetical protein
MRKTFSPVVNARDEALWAAYQRREKTAVTEELFRRSLARVVRQEMRPASDTIVNRRSVGLIPA